MFGLTKKEMRILRKLDNEKKIQDFVNRLEVNFEENGETCMSPRRVLKERKAHCIEAALLAYLAFKLHNKKAWLVDLKTTPDDFEHVICVFKKYGKYGCISKSNHIAHRYREPVYRDIRELVMSIFHEYIDKKGRKTLRSYSVPVTLEKFGDRWVTDEKDLWEVHDYLDSVRHFPILNKKQLRNLRKADRFEIKLGNMEEKRFK